MIRAVFFALALGSAVAQSVPVLPPLKDDSAEPTSVVTQPTAASADSVETLASLVEEVELLRERLSDVETSRAVDEGVSVFNPLLAKFFTVASSPEASGFLSATSVAVADAASSACKPSIDTLCDQGEGDVLQLITERLPFYNQCFDTMTRQFPSVEASCVTAAHSALRHLLGDRDAILRQGAQVALRESFNALSLSCGQAITYECSSDATATPPYIPEGYTPGSHEHFEDEEDFEGHHGPHRRLLGLGRRAHFARRHHGKHGKHGKHAAHRALRDAHGPPPHHNLRRDHADPSSREHRPPHERRHGGHHGKRHHHSSDDREALRQEERPQHFEAEEEGAVPVPPPPPPPSTFEDAAPDQPSEDVVIIAPSKRSLSASRGDHPKRGRHDGPPSHREGRPGGPPPPPPPPSSRASSESSQSSHYTPRLPEGIPTELGTCVARLMKSGAGGEMCTRAVSNFVTVVQHVLPPAPHAAEPAQVHHMDRDPEDFEDSDFSRWHHRHGRDHYDDDDEDGGGFFMLVVVLFVTSLCCIHRRLRKRRLFARLRQLEAANAAAAANPGAAPTAATATASAPPHPQPQGVASTSTQEDAGLLQRPAPASYPGRPLPYTSQPLTGAPVALMHPTAPQQQPAAAQQPGLYPVVGSATYL